MKLEENYFFLFSMGGDGKKEPRKQILSELKGFVPEDIDGEILRFSTDTRLSMLYLFDADSKGIDDRLSAVKSEIQEVFNSHQVDSFAKNGSSIVVNSIKIGSYVFSEEDTGKGKLEDILIPMMKKGNERVFQNAENYLTENSDETRHFPLKIKISDNGDITEERSSRNQDKTFDLKKSVIGTVAQLQRSGATNTVCISHSDYLTLEKIRNNQKCKELIDLIQAFLK
ncbi:MAG: hypothetical protein JKX84_06815 [Flavobacteriales bacterium]|nr:hypothetical protein [Flavobacteriales bacterium]